MSDEIFSHSPRHRLTADTASGISFSEREDGSSAVEGVCGFDFEEVFGRLDGCNLDHVAEVREGVAEALKEVLVRLVFDKNGDLRDGEGIGRQVLSLCYVLEITDKTPLSDIAEREEISKQAISKRVGEINQRFGIRRRLQPDAASRTALAISVTGSRHWRAQRRAANAAQGAQPA